MGQRTKICELENGANFSIPVVLNSVTPLKTRAGKDYLAVEAFDGTESIKGNYWDWGGNAMPEAKTVVYTLQGQVTTWEGAKQLKITSINTNKDFTPTDFLPHSDSDLDTMYTAAMNAIDKYVTIPILHDICKEAFETYEEDWMTAPGAKFVHHAFVGGTLVHCVETANIALAIVDGLPEGSTVNVSLVVAGALLHDVGKLFAYEFKGATPDMTTVGMLKEHSYLGARLIDNLAAPKRRTDEDRLYTDLLTHIILSHHNTPEFGAVITPACMEAIIVAAADDLDAKHEILKMAYAKSSKLFTDKVWAISNKPMINGVYIQEQHNLPSENE